MEKQFIIDTVNDAVELIEEKGKEAFEIFKDKSSKFVYFDTCIFVISMEGKAIVDPAFPSKGGRDLLDLKDAMGKYLVREMIEKLKTADSAWVSYMWPQPGQTALSRKAAYIRKVDIGGKSYIVGSAIFLSNPIWLKL
ncbi:MAG: cache domain-containing protein, partial [Candidatus Omnitrophota bacterium]